jgi:predicted O-methyltransferase YrrM
MEYSDWPNINWETVDRRADCFDYEYIFRVVNNIRARGENTDFSSYDRQKLLEQFRKVIGRKAILEIGVDNNPDNLTSTSVFLDNKANDMVYIGVDINDKSNLNDDEKNIFTLIENSENMDSVIAFANSKGVTEFDFIFLDGWHSVDMVQKELRYAEYLAPGGIIGFHDINHHPGPIYALQNLDTNIWNIEYFRSEDGDPMNDFGVAFISKK